MRIQGWIRPSIFKFFLLFVAGSGQFASAADENEAFPVFSSDRLYSGGEAPGCKAMLDSYCSYLHSPEAQGNLEVKRSETSTKILQGETRNQLSQVYYRYSQAKLKNRDRLPRDLRDELARQSYFVKLEEFLARRPRQQMSLPQRLAYERKDFELGSIWTGALHATVLARMGKKFPGFHKLSDRMVPVEWQLEQKRIRRNLFSEVSLAIWSGDPNWKKVEESFARLRESFLHVIDSLDLPDELRADWAGRIREVKLVLPGALPAVSNEECSSTTANAFYYSYLNVITVCAGDFNSEDIVQTLAHEMAHSLGIDRSQYLFLQRSRFAAELGGVRDKVCRAADGANKSAAEFSCAEWGNFKARLQGSLKSIEGYRAEVPDFQRCLQRRSTTKEMGKGDIERVARRIVNDRVSRLAANDRFLRITKAEIPMPNGKTQKNPNYMNPCSYYLWSQGEEPVSDELTTLLFFTAEYRCSKLEPVARMRHAIEESKRMTTAVLERVLKVEGEFSWRAELESGGFASPPFERFADVVGSYAMADLLADLPESWDRQNKFLAGSSWQCMEPSLASHYPEESAVEQAYIFDPHTEGAERRKELFSAPVREALGCKKDFEFDECSLPFRRGIGTPGAKRSLTSLAP